MLNFVQTMMEDDIRVRTTILVCLSHSGFIFGWYFFYTVLDCFPAHFDRWRIQSSKVTANRLAQWIMTSGLCGSTSKNYVAKQLAEHGEKPFFLAEKVVFLKTALHCAVQHFLLVPVLWWWLMFTIMSQRWLNNNPELELEDFSTTKGLPSLLTIILHQFFFALCEDTMFYWGHRSLHTGPLYRAIHKVHHEHHRPISLGAEYSHPVEGLLGNIIPFLMGPLLTGCHFYELCIWFGVRMTETAEAHSGYRIPIISIYSMFPWSGVLMHDYHHSHNQGAYGSFFQFWDYACGTNKQYNEFVADKRSAEKKKIAALTKKK